MLVDTGINKTTILVHIIREEADVWGVSDDWLGQDAGQGGAGPAAEGEADPGRDHRPDQELLDSVLMVYKCLDFPYGSLELERCGGALELELGVLDGVGSFDDGSVLDLLHGRPGQVDLVVDHEERVVVLEHVVVERDAVQVLLEQRLQQRVVRGQRLLLLLDGQLVQEHLA